VICKKCKKIIPNDSDVCVFCYSIQKEVEHQDNINKDIEGTSNVNYQTKTEIKPLAFWGVLILIISIILNFTIIKPTLNKQREEERYKTYKLDLIKTEELLSKWDYIHAYYTVVSYLPKDNEPINRKYSDAIVLYNYGISLEHFFKNNNYEMASYIMNDDTNFLKALKSYNGKFKNEIFKFQKRVALAYSKQKKEKKLQERKYEVTRNQRGVSIGMTEEQVLESNWGRPEHINRTVTTYGREEQWVYPNSNYLYFEEDEYGMMILKTIQN
jgi:hypothetical protein